MSVLGFDNISYAALPNIRLSTVDQQKRLLVETTMQYLLEYIEAPSPLRAEMQLIQPVLLERGTCRKL